MFICPTTATTTDFKFGMRALMDNPDMAPENFFSKNGCPGSRDPVNFWALNGNSSKMAKNVDFPAKSRHALF